MHDTLSNTTHNIEHMRTTPFSADTFHEASASYSPTIFSLQNTDKKLLLEISENLHITILNTLEEQLKELAQIVLLTSDSQQHSEFIENELLAHKATLFSYGNWIYYPNKRAMVHLLTKQRFWELISSRNQYKITTEEQEILRKKRIGIVGLSVGHCCACCIAQEGLCGELRISDADTLSLSNLNRLRSSVLQLGKNKTEICLQDILAFDPYLPIVPYASGLQDENLYDFCFKGGKLDLIVEECDNLYLKFKIREKARDWGIPVIMETNDRGMIDIERFDLEPNRAPFHGILDPYQAEDIKVFSEKDKIDTILKLVGGSNNISLRLKDSLSAIGSKLTSYPQLSSEVHLGGAITATMARKILLNQHQRSGRYYVDLEKIFNDAN